MKRIIENKIYLLFLLPFIGFVSSGVIFGVDIWYMIAGGRYVLNNGIPYVDPLTIHEGLKYVMQQWLSSIIFYLVHSQFGTCGLLILTIILFAIIIFLIYKLCLLISSNKKVSIILTTLIALTFSILEYVDIRPHMFSIIIYLLFIYLIEKYMKTNNKKILFLLPILSILEINLHASMWLFIFVLSLPYIAEMIFNIIKKNKVKYDMKYLFIFIGISFLCGFINPYGLDAITYLFNSRSFYIDEWVGEMRRPAFFSLYSVVFITGVVVYSYIFIFKNNKKKFDVRYLCMFFGTLLLSQANMKSYFFYIIFGMYPIAYYFKDFKFESNKKIFKIMDNIVCAVIIILTAGYCCLYKNIYIARDSRLEKPVDFLLEHYNVEDIRLYNSYYSGPYLEYRGIKTYIDSRAELFLKSNNKKDDIFIENFRLRRGEIELEDLIEKYNFTHLFINRSVGLAEDINFNRNSIKGYTLVYEDEHVKIYARDNIKTIK